MPDLAWLDADDVVEAGLADVRRGGSSASRRPALQGGRRAGRVGAVRRAARVGRLPRPVPPHRRRRTGAVPRPVGADAPDRACRGRELRARRPSTDAAAPGCSSLIRELAVVHGKVTLSSGRRPTTTSTCAGSPCTPRPPRWSAEVHARPARTAPAWRFDAVGGLTLGADPVADGDAARRRRRGAGRSTRSSSARRARRTACSAGSRARTSPGRRVVAVEDTSTTGGSVLTAVEALREAGAEVRGVAVIVDRATGARENVEAAGPGVPLRLRPGGARPRLTPRPPAHARDARRRDPADAGDTNDPTTATAATA